MNWVKPILDQYAPKDIYNWDETALFWRSSSGASFVTANEELIKGRKKIKARVTILTGVSMAGEKCPLMSIGAANKPRWPIVCVYENKYHTTAYTAYTSILLLLLGQSENFELFQVTSATSRSFR